jgi:hypothetical protein
MTKKTAHSRSTAQRSKPKTQKSIELVRQTPIEKEVEHESDLEEVSNGVAISTATTSEIEKEDSKTVATTVSVPKTSASARLAARRQSAQKTQRSTAALITAEHYRYVRNDLIYIAILAAVMFSILIVLFFVLR